eukprot:m.31831 g.31831  ORF g.31831 m.31831 type:complete len:117 (+) comp14047_c0_seq1:85-435(+)
MLGRHVRTAVRCQGVQNAVSVSKVSMSVLVSKVSMLVLVSKVSMSVLVSKTFGVRLAMCNTADVLVVTLGSTFLLPCHVVEAMLHVDVHAFTSAPLDGRVESDLPSPVVRGQGNTN